MRLCAPSQLDASPMRHCSRSRPTSPTASHGPRNGVAGHRSRSRPTSPTASPQGPQAVALVVRRPTSHNCVYLTHFRFHRKKRLGFNVPRHAKLGKNLQRTTIPSSAREMKRFTAANRRTPSTPPCVRTAGPGRGTRRRSADDLVLLEGRGLLGEPGRCHGIHRLTIVRKVKKNPLEAEIGGGTTGPRAWRGNTRVCVQYALSRPKYAEVDCRESRSEDSLS